MRKLCAALIFLLCLVSSAGAQTLTALARVEAERSEVRDGWFGGTTMTLGLSQGVPFRVFTLDAPRRLVVDFSEARFEGLAPTDILPKPGAVSALRFGSFAPGWSRLVADLEAPLQPDSISMEVDDATGAATLRIDLTEVDDQFYAKASGVPEGVEWGAPNLPEPSPRKPKSDQFVVVLDPGHGGIDPGAEREGLVEKDIALDFALTVRDILRREGITVEMTRDDDRFVSLEGRTAFAHQMHASVFVSIHADALSGGGARGATVYTLSEKASDIASEQLAARHNRSDILSGIDLSDADDEVTGILLDLMRQETEPRTEALAQTIIKGMADAGGPMNNKAWRQAGFSVLKSADIPSVLVEIGFLSDARDRKNLRDPVWLSVIAGGLADALIAWRDTDAARAQLVRK